MQCIFRPAISDRLGLRKSKGEEVLTDAPPTPTATPACAHTYAYMDMYTDMVYMHRLVQCGRWLSWIPHPTPSCSPTSSGMGASQLRSSECFQHTLECARGSAVRTMPHHPPHPRVYQRKCQQNCGASDSCLPQRHGLCISLQRCWGQQAARLWAPCLSEMSNQIYLSNCQAVLSCFKCSAGLMPCAHHTSASRASAGDVQAFHLLGCMSGCASARCGCP